MHTVSERTPRIYVACLASYNGGRLHGRWIDADQPADDIRGEIADMLKESPDPNIEKRDHECLASSHNWSTQVALCEITQDVSGEATPFCPECRSKSVKSGPAYPTAEEWAIHDYEGFGGYPISEGEDMEAIAELAELLDEHGEIFGEVASHLGTIENAKRLYENGGYCGEWDSLEDYGADLLEQTGQLEGLSESLRYYFDFEAFGRDMERNGDIVTIEDGRRVHVFDANA